jgi:hypothetical protein
MLNRTHWLVYLLLVASLAVTACSSKVEIPTLVAHEKQYPEVRKKYVYQSVIRIANIKRDPNFEKLIKDLRKVILYMPPGGDSTYQITTLRSGIRKDGFEELLDIRTADAQRISLWVKESGEHAQYVAFVDSEKGDIILEIDGEIHPEYLTALAGADQSSLLDLLKGGF